MRFLVRFANEKKFKPSDAKALASSTYQLVREDGTDIGNLRVSSAAVELDLLLKSRDGLEAATQALEKVLGPLLTVRELDTPPLEMDEALAIREGLGFFNEERYWESHEALEYAWRRTSGAEKDVLQGIILIAAGLVHLQKNESNIALSILTRASEKLSTHPGEHFGISVDNLLETLSRMIAAKDPEFFRIDVGPYSRDAAV
jgi:hypothetical protein